MAQAFNTMAARLQARVRDEQTIKEGLAARVNELDLLNRMGELFQACLSVEEAYAVIGRLAPRLFPTEAGAVLALNPARTMLEVVATWARPVDGTMFPAQACWPLRNRRPHGGEAKRASVLCEHLPGPPPTAYMCTPLVAQGNSLGILYVSSDRQADDEEPGLSEAKQHLADTVAAQVGLGLSNVQLREILRIQSI